MKEDLGEPKYFRCQTCRRLLTDRLIRQGKCAGHGDITYATNGSFWEWVQIKLGFIK